MRTMPVGPMVEGLGIAARRRLGRARSIPVLGAAIAALALLALGGGGRPPLVIYNASASAPIGFYRVLPAWPLERGELVLARTPPAVRSLAAERGYLPADCRW